MRPTSFVALAMAGLFGCGASGSPTASPTDNAAGAGGSSGHDGGSGSGAGGTTSNITPVGAGTAGSDGGGAGSAQAGSSSGGGVAPIGEITGAEGVWEPMLKWPKDTQPNSGEGVLVDPARSSDFYYFYQTPHLNSGDRHVLKSTDYGLTWEQIDETTVVGDAWGNAIDPNPQRDPNTPPTMYTPAGYGDMGIWKSTDGGVTWVNLFAGVTDGIVPAPGGGTSQFPPGKSGERIDFYQVHILPDDPPNHILITYHYGAPDSKLPLGESKDGGATWEVHSLPGGDSHYVLGVDATTWIAISGENSGGGTYRTTTAGRIGGQISLDAWTKVDDMEHPHGSFTPWNDVSGGYLYFPVKQGIKRSNDGGATWTSVYAMGTMGTLVATSEFVYAETLFQDAMWRASVADPTDWPMFAPPDDAAWWGGGVPPFGAASSSDGKRSVIIRAQLSELTNNAPPLITNGEIWRYVEP
jgi:hypothetical protein